MQGKKRKATSQLSPYTNGEDDSYGVNSSAAKEALPGHRTAHAQPGASTVTYGGKYTDIFSSSNLFPGLQKQHEKRREKISSLNKCFLKSIRKVIGVDAAKDLTFLFEQYSKHLNKISGESSADDNNKLI